MSTSTNSDYAVGHKKPPRDNRYQKGQSGNPKGRPKGRSSMADLVIEAMNKPIQVSEGGKKRRMASIEAMVRIAKMNALQDKPGAVKEFLEILDMVGRTDDLTEEDWRKRAIHLPRSYTEGEWKLIHARALEKERQRYLAKVDNGTDIDGEEDASNVLVVPPAIKRGDELAERGQVEQALAEYRAYIASNKSPLAEDDSNQEAKENVQLGAARIGILADRHLLAGNFDIARRLADEALTHLPHRLWIEMIRAHTLMFLRQPDDAKKFYLQFRTDTRMAEPSWESVILRDFAELRAAGHSHPLMDEIEQHLAAAGWTAQGPAKKSVKEMQQARPELRGTLTPTLSTDLSDSTASTPEPVAPISDSVFMLMNPYSIRTGDLYATQGELDNALVAYRASLDDAKAKLAQNPNDATARHDRHCALDRIGDVIFRLILARRHGEAMECAVAAIRDEPESLRHQQNLAHAHLFLAHVTAARQIYEQYYGKKLEDGTTWQERILQDFGALRNAGLKHPLIDNIERQFRR